MKAFLITAFAFMLAVSACEAKPALSEAQVSEIGRLVISQREHQQYKELFSTTKPKYDSERKLWMFTWVPRKGQNYPGASMYFFELRDSDAYYRIGELTTGAGVVPKTALKFRMSTRLRRKIAKIINK